MVLGSIGVELELELELELVAARTRGRLAEELSRHPIKGPDGKCKAFVKHPTFASINL